ncbi:Nmad5 family putative nucleotide modification protein [Aeromonas veronii]
MRLTNQIKQQIVTAAIAKAGIPAEEEALRLRRVDWAEAVRVDSLGGKEGAEAVDKAIEQIKAITKALPEGVTTGYQPINVDSNFYLNCGGISLRPRFNGTFGYDSHLEEIRKPCRSFKLAADHPLAIEFHQLEQDAKSLKEKREHIENSVAAAMSGISTDNQLLKVWPEAAELMPKEIQKVQLPAVQTADLNALIGLPSEKEAA